MECTLFCIERNGDGKQNKMSKNNDKKVFNCCL